MGALDLHRLRVLLSRLYQGEEGARTLIEDVLRREGVEVGEEMVELLKLLQTQEMLPDDVLEEILAELGNASG